MGGLFPGVGGGGGGHIRGIKKVFWNNEIKRFCETNNIKVNIPLHLKLHS